jgi:hypothetical protein
MSAPVVAAPAETATVPADLTPARPRRTVDPLELAYVGLALALGAAAWCALVLAELGLFLGLAGALASILIGLAAGVALVRSVVGAAGLARPRRLALAAALGLLALGAAILARPHEYLLGGLDPGVYVNTAASIATRGAIAYQDATLLALPDPARAALFPEPFNGWTYGSRLLGFYVADLATARIVPHGMHLFPAAMAIGYALGGWPVALLVPPLLALVAIGGVALLARRLAGPAAGLGAAGLLLFNPAESWFGRYPAAEDMLQAWLFAGLVALALALDLAGERALPAASDGSPGRGGSLGLRSAIAVALAAGALLGLVHLTKIETFPLPIAVALVLGRAWLIGRFSRVHAAFLLAYLATLLHVALHVATISGWYAYSVYARSLPPLPIVLVAAVAVALLALAAPLLRRRLGSLRRRLVDALAPGAVPLALALTLLLLGAYAWYVRPLDLFGELARVPEPFQASVRNRLHALPRLGWYLPPLAILLAGTGLAAALGRARGAALALLLATGAIEALVVLSDPRITPEYPWAARRWVGVLIPVASALAAAQLAWLLPPRWRPLDAALARAALPAGLALALLASSAGASAPLLRHREYAGAGALVDRIAAQIAPGSIVLLDDDLVGWRFSAPLEFLAGRSSFVLFGQAAGDERVAAALDSWERAGRRVYWLRYREGGAYRVWDRLWRPSGRWQTDLPEVAPTVESPPGQTRRFDIPVVLYEALRGDG